MPEDHIPFFQRKTTWAALMTAAASIAGALSGTIDAQTAFNATTQAVLALCLRSAINAK